MHKGSHDLARRAVKFQLLGLSFREYLELGHGFKFPSYTLKELTLYHERIASEIINDIEARNQKILPLFNRYLDCGYYPYYFELPNEEHYFLTLEQNLHTTIESDIPAIYPHLTGVSIGKMKQLLHFIAKSVPFTPNWNHIKEALDIGDVRTLKTYFQYMEDAFLIRSVKKGNHKLDHIHSSGKVYLDNPNQMQALSPENQNSGTKRELFFLDMLSSCHQITVPLSGDFLVDGHFVFEIGGRNKKFNQIKNEKTAFLANDSIEVGIGNKLPLWLLGFLY